jgi:hypothetical protein
MSATDHIVDALSRLEQFTQSHADRNRPPAITVALSRQAGSQGPEIAQAVGRRLDWPVYDQELLTHIAAQKGLQQRLLESLDERSVGWIEELVASFCTQSGSLGSIYLVSMLKLLAALSKAGSCVIVGRGAAHVLPPETTLSVRLVAPREVRVVNVQRHRSWSPTEAQHWVDQTDRQRDRFVKQHFGKDNSDPLNYHLVLNSHRLTPADCAMLIVEAARLRETHIMSHWAPASDSTRAPA